MSTSNPGGPSPIDMDALRAEFDASGQSAAAFARSRGTAPWRIYNALNRRKGKTRLRVDGERPTLLPVRVVPDARPARAATLEVELAGGHRLRIGSDFDAVLLRRVLGALAQC